MFKNFILLFYFFVNTNSQPSYDDCFEIALDLLCTESMSFNHFLLDRPLLVGLKSNLSEVCFSMKTIICSQDFDVVNIEIYLAIMPFTIKPFIFPLKPDLEVILDLSSFFSPLHILFSYSAQNSFRFCINLLPCIYKNATASIKFDILKIYKHCKQLKNSINDSFITIDALLDEKMKNYLDKNQLVFGEKSINAMESMMFTKLINTAQKVKNLNHIPMEKYYNNIFKLKSKAFLCDWSIKKISQTIDCLNILTIIKNELEELYNSNTNVQNDNASSNGLEYNAKESKTIQDDNTQRILVATGTKGNQSNITTPIGNKGTTAKGTTGTTGTQDKGTTPIVTTPIVTPARGTKGNTGTQDKGTTAKGTTGTTPIVTQEVKTPTGTPPIGTPARGTKGNTGTQDKGTTAKGTTGTTPIVTQEVKTPTGTMPIGTPAKGTKGTTPIVTQEVKTPTGTMPIGTPAKGTKGTTPIVTQEVKTPTGTPPIGTPARGTKGNTGTQDKGTTGTTPIVTQEVKTPTGTMPIGTPAKGTTPIVTQEVKTPTGTPARGTKGNTGTTAKGTTPIVTQEVKTPIGTPARGTKGNTGTPAGGRTTGTKEWV